MADEKKKGFSVPETDDKSPLALTVEAPPSTKQIVKDMLSELMPAMMAMMQASMMASRPVDSRAERAAVASGPKCSECKQLLRACEGKHTQMVVYPQKYHEFGPWFRGVGINGIWYLSSNPSQYITVPEKAAGDISNAVIVYEENERETRMGRTAEFNSGTLNSPRAAGASAGWR